MSSLQKLQQQGQPEASSSRLSATYRVPPASSEHQDVQQIEHDPNAEDSISLHVPTSLLLLPPTAALIGMGIGMSRGGSRARLRFLAENAHRQPKTVQGWVRFVVSFQIKSYMLL